MPVVVLNGGEEIPPPPTLEVEWGLVVDGGGDERRDTSAEAATVASSLMVKLSFTKSDKFFAANKRYTVTQHELKLLTIKENMILVMFTNCS